MARASGPPGPRSPARWALLSPRLDELLDLGEPARSQRLQAWRELDPTLADDLQAVLRDADSAHARRFLEGDALGGPAPVAQQAGQRCGAWTLQHLLGTGGMGSVWLAVRSDGRYEGRAAIKLPHAALRARGGAERFEREGRLLARLSHPHIAALLDAGVTTEGQPYLVLEFVQGKPITDWCDERRCSVTERIDLVLEVLDAAAHAHQQLVLHRDLKPANILVDDGGRVKLLDFGIAKLIDPDADSATADQARTTLLAFTPDHAAPEQLQGEKVGTASDVYAVGVLLYQLLTGAHPTAEPAHTPVQRLRAVVENVPLPMSEAAARAGAEAAARRGLTPQRLARALRADLDTIVAKALKKNPAERYAGAAALADDLRRWRCGAPVAARPDSTGYRVTRFVQRHRLAVGAAAASVMLLLAGVVGTAWQARQARLERDEARWQAERALARGNLFNLMLGQMGRLDQPLTQRQILEQATEVVDRTFADQPRLAVELLLPIAGQFHTLGDVQADLKVMQRAARYAAASGDPALVASAACATVDTQIALGRPDAAAALVQQAEAALSGLPEPPAVLQATCWHGEAMAARALGQDARALAASERARRRLADSDNLRGNVYPSVLSLLAALRREHGDNAGALAALGELIALTRANGLAGSLDARMQQRHRALLLADAGEIADAAAVMEQTLSDWAGGSAPPALLLTMAELQLQLGELQAAERSVARAGESLQALGAVEFEAEWRLMQARQALAQGRTTSARQALEGLEARPGAARLRYQTCTPGTTRALLRLAEGDAPAALAAIQAELQRLETRPSQLVEQRADAWRNAARIALAAGDAARAQAWAGLAADASTRVARDPRRSAHVGEALLLQARALQSRGEAAAAADAAASAGAALVRGLGAAHPLAAQAEALR